MRVKRLLLLFCERFYCVEHLRLVLDFGPSHGVLKYECLSDNVTQYDVGYISGTYYIYGMNTFT